MKKKIIRFLEILILCMILLSLIIGIPVYKHAKKLQKASYNIIFKDVDGLKVGAPVRLMGLQIGYVSTVQIIDDDEIFLSFIITSDNVEIPNNALAGVESYGIVGSKSLEIYPPLTDTKEGLFAIQIKNPTRIVSVYDNMSTIQEIIFAASTNFNNIIETEKIPHVKGFLKKAPSISYNINDRLEIITDTELNISKKIRNNNFDKSIRHFSAKMEELVNGKSSK